MEAAKEIKFQAYTLNIEHIPVEVLANTIQPFMDQYRETGVKELEDLLREIKFHLITNQLSDVERTKLVLKCDSFMRGAERM